MNYCSAVYVVISLRDKKSGAEVKRGCSERVVVGIVRHHEKQIPQPMRLGSGWQVFGGRNI